MTQKLVNRTNSRFWHLLKDFAQMRKLLVIQLFRSITKITASNLSAFQRGDTRDIIKESQFCKRSTSN